MQKRAAKDEKKSCCISDNSCTFCFQKKSIYESKWFIVKWVEAAEEEEVKCLLAASAFYPANK